MTGDNAGLACALREPTQETSAGGHSGKAQENEMRCLKTRQDIGRWSPGLGYIPVQDASSIHDKHPAQEER